MDPFGPVAAAVALLIATAFGVWRRRSGGHLSAAPDAEASAGAPNRARPGAAGHRIDPALLLKLGVESERVTLLQFSSAFCAPCRATRRVCAEVAELVPDVRHVEVDAESHLDAVRALHIWRTPTVLVLDGAGVILRRATGVPSKPQVIAAVGELLARD